LRAYIVVDLGFGDSGKGLLTDFLVRRLQAGVVVRYNGGAQAGHNVITPDGRHHTFSQFGSGTFVSGVNTYLSKHVVIHPGALLLEGDILARKGVRDAFSRLRLSDQALVITPFHQAANRIREIARRADRHGSCGVGVGEAFEDALLFPEDRVLAGDLTNPNLLWRKLRSIRDRKHAQVAELCGDGSLGPLFAREWEIFTGEDVIDAWIASITRIGELGLVAPDTLLERWLRQTETVIFEGAQGVLLDAEAGFHPYTTWSNCTAANAFDLLKEMAPDSPAYQIGVTRAYAIRHGPGPLPTGTEDLTSVISEHNQYNEWQGAVRYGWFDAVLTRYVLDVTGGVACLAVTHLDVLSHLKTWTYCPGYKGWPALDDVSVGSVISDGVLTSFRLPPDLALTQREKLTRALATVVPVLETCGPDKDSVIKKIGALIGRPVDIISCGPSAGNVQLIGSIPT
jgi:adenylosuccinate synthase